MVDFLVIKNEADFRATRDLDMVLVIEALTLEFTEKYWEVFCLEGYMGVNKK